MTTTINKIGLQKWTDIEKLQAERDHHRAVAAVVKKCTKMHNIKISNKMGQGSSHAVVNKLVKIRMMCFHGNVIE